MIVRLPDVAAAARWAAPRSTSASTGPASRLVVEIETLGRPAPVLLSYQSARGRDGPARGRDRRCSGLAEPLAREVGELTELRPGDGLPLRPGLERRGDRRGATRATSSRSSACTTRPPTSRPRRGGCTRVNWTRLIADVDYAPVPLQPVLDPATRAPLDLSFSMLRSVSPIHLEYLQQHGRDRLDVDLAGRRRRAVGPDRLPPLLRAAPAQPGRPVGGRVPRPGRLPADRRARPRRRRAASAADRDRCSASSSAASAAPSTPAARRPARRPRAADAARRHGGGDVLDGRSATRGNVPPPTAPPVIVDRLLGPEDGSMGHTDRLGDARPGAGGVRRPARRRAA